MNFDPKSVRKALMIAKQLAASVDPAFARISPPMPPQGVPLERAAGGAVDDELLPQRNLNDMGMYSAAAEAARNLPQERGTLQQMLATMKGVKPDEIKWSGVQNKFAGQKTVTRDELAQHFEKQMPPLEEDDKEQFESYMVPGGSNYRAKLLALPPDRSSQTYGTDFGRFTNRAHWAVPNVVAHLLMKDREYAPVKRIPKPDSAINISMREENGNPFKKKVDAWKTPTPGLFVTRSEELGDKRSYVVTHEGTGLNVCAGNSYPFHKAMDAARRLGEWYDGWTQDVNVLGAWGTKNGAKAREVLSQAVNPFAKKALHLDELQSDWGQQGRDSGFTTDDKIEAAERNLHRLRDEINNQSDRVGSMEFMAERTGRLPEWQKALSELENERKKKIEAPYVTNTTQWTDLGLKRALVEAARGNYDKLIWTPGSVISDRYKLSRHVDKLEYKKFENGQYHVSALKNGRVVHTGSHAEEDLPGFFGKEIAKKMISNQAESTSFDGASVLSGPDLNIGNRGAFEYYDNILPRRLLALAQEHDPEAKIEPHKEAKDKTKNFPSLRITPRMRESILKRGFKAFKRGGAVQEHLFHHHDERNSVEVPVMDHNKAIRRALMIAKADGGRITDDQSAPEPNIQQTASPKRILVNAEGKGGVRGIIIPRHMWEGTSKATGMRKILRARAEVYGSENRDPLTIGQIGKIHKQVLDEHFAKPVDQQIAAENAALQRLQKARHISPGADTLDESEKLDTVRHERDEAGRTYVAYGSKGVAGHALYTSGYGPNQKQVVLNTCPGQTVGCGGGVGPDGIVDTSRGTCFAPNAESQYVNAAIRRACHAQAKHDPAMTTDWILAHTGALRNAAQRADKKNKVVLFRPNVVDESDTSSRYVISNLNRQRAEAGKPNIIANSYGKTNELHDPENGYFVTYSNAGPKTKLGYSVTENISRDKQRARATVFATDAAGRDFQNEQGNNTPPKNSYMVTDVKRGSDLNKAMEKAFKYAKYWSTGRMPNELSPEEQAEGPEGHFDGEGNPTTPEEAHYGHTTLNGRRYDYQKQHILHPRLVNVPERKKNKKTGRIEKVDHLIPTDSRFKDDEYLPKDRFMTKNGKVAGAILMTTPTTSTSNVGHQTSFTHHVDNSHIDYANQNNGEYQIDPPEEQEASIGKEYIPPQEIKFRADGGAVQAEFDNDDLAAFPEQSYMAQRHNAHKSEEHPPEHHHAHRAAPVVAPNINRALQIASRFGMTPGMIPPYGRR